MGLDFIIYNGYLIVSALVLPLLAALGAWKIKNENFREGVTIFCGLLTIFFVAEIYQVMDISKGVSLTITEIFEGAAIKFKVDYLGILFAIVASVLWVVTTIYSIGYMRGNNEANQGRFYCFFAISIFAALGVAFAGNMLTLFIFYEILTICTYPLVTHSGTEEAKKNGRKYLGILLGTSIGLQLPAILWTYFTAGTLDFTDKAILEDKITAMQAGILLLLYIYGVGKAAVMPFHKWLPAAMVAPTPVSALLHAVAVVKAGLFTILKIIVYVFGVDNLQGMLAEDIIAVGWVPWAAAFTVITASIIAIRQDNLKLRLAYSTVSQLSYVVMAAGLFNYKAIMAGSVHIASHAFAKITLFFAAGAIYTASKKKKVSELAGLAKRMPITAAAFTIGALSMIGLPPTAGIISKFYLMQAAHIRSEYFVIELIISTVLNTAYFLPIILAMYFKKEEVPAQGKYKNHGEAPRSILIAMGITSTLVVLMFIYPDYFLEMAEIFSTTVK
jgi:multicomponent Na+:H+ antiporter subunit D